MALPSSITTITVSGKYLGVDGSAATGTVTFAPSIVATTDGTLLPIAPTTVELNTYGGFSVDLAATDDADWDAPGFTYTVTERITGARPRTYSIQVPAASPTLDLATVVPVASADSVSQYYLKAGGAISGSVSVGGTLGVTGATTLGSVTATTLSASGNGTVSGTLNVTGTTTLGTVNAGAVSVTSVTGTKNTDANSVFLTNTVSGGNLNNPQIRVDSPTSTSLFFGARVTGDTIARFLSRVDGLLQWGDGTTTRDTQLARASTAQLRITPSANASSSSSVGGALNITNSASTGAGLVVYSDQAAPAGHLIVARANNATFTQAAIFVDYVGTNHGLRITHAGTGTASGAIVVTSTNTADSAIQVTGTETNRGTIKVTHTGQADGSDSSAAALSIDLKTAGTAAQGIFITATTGDSTGNYFTARSSDNATDRFVVKASGSIGIGVPAGATPRGGIDLRSTALYIGNQSAPGTPTAGGFLYVESGILKYKGSSGTITQLAVA